MNSSLIFYQEELQKLLSRNRYEHSIRVVDTALEIASKKDLDTHQVHLAALVHDRGKELSETQLMATASKQNLIQDKAEEINPELLHGPVGAWLINQEWGITDLDVLNAVKNHTTGAPKMSELEKVIFLADCIEPGRDYPALQDIREAVFTDIDLGIKTALDNIIKLVIKRNWVLHPNTIWARNEFFMK